MKIVEFIYDKITKHPKRLWNNVFVIFSPERIRLQPGENDKNRYESINLSSKSDFFACTLLLTCCKNGLKLESCFYISAGDNTNNLNQPINLPWKLQFKLVNRS